MLDCSLTKHDDWSQAWFLQGIKTLGDERPIFHRKQWELVSCIQALQERGMLSPGKRGLVFGVGQERLPAIFASRGCHILATDQLAENASGWTETNQHCRGLEILKNESIIPDEEFYKRVSFRNVDMNDIPKDLYEQFDFCWSICALEHLGSIDLGLKFIRESLKCLKPGGIAFHTTEYNVSHEDGSTQDNTSSVFFRRDDIEDMAIDMTMEPRDYSLGSHVYDWQVAYQPNPPAEPHLKVQVGDFIITCIRLIIQAS